MKNKLVIGAALIVLSSCLSKEEVLHEQYRVEGLALYEKHCQNCHQADGKGFKKLYPALVGTNLLKRVTDEQFAILVKKGIKADEQHAYMPGNKELQAIEIAEIITYVKDLNGVKERIVDQRLVMKVIQ